MQDPEIYLNELGLEVGDFFDPETPAVLDAEHRVIVNHDVYFFATLESRDRFARDPKRWVNQAHDPVTFARFVPDAHTLQTVFEGRRYLFATPATYARFVADPPPFVKPTGRMRGMPPGMGMGMGMESANPGN